jgi:hypothetical protein
MLKMGGEKMKWNKWLWWNTPKKRLKVMLEIYSLLKSDINTIYNEVDKGSLGFINVRPELNELALQSYTNKRMLDIAEKHLSISEKNVIRKDKVIESKNKTIKALRDRIDNLMDRIDSLETKI